MKSLDLQQIEWVRQSGFEIERIRVKSWAWQVTNVRSRASDSRENNIQSLQSLQKSLTISISNPNYIILTFKLWLLCVYRYIHGFTIESLQCSSPMEIKSKFHAMTYNLTPSIFVLLNLISLCHPRKQIKNSPTNFKFPLRRFLSYVIYVHHKANYRNSYSSAWQV